MKTAEPIFVTTALPYANGPIHLGHLVEHIQADIWVRFQKMKGQCCFFVCADDAHGTPVMLKAKELGQDIEQMLQDIQVSHMASFKSFLVDHDVYHTTHSKENKRWVETVYALLLERGFIETKEIEQFYDEKGGMFLPDRYVLGTCPKCGENNQYGDGCEKCGSVYSPDDLLDPISALSGTQPKKRSSLHRFFCLSKTQEFLKRFLDHTALESSVSNKLREWFGMDLKDWDITRDAPYFGFLIPGTQDQYFYVWLDAPLGYFAAIEHLGALKGLEMKQYLSGDKPCKLYHFIGKDIIYFHGLFWPAILNVCDLKAPDNLFVHGFLNVDGKKMSKSRGTFINADDYLKHLPPESLRYFLASRLTSGIDDLNLDFLELKQQFNSDVVGKVVNIASRITRFLHQHFDGVVLAQMENSILDAFVKAEPLVAKAYEERNFAKAVKLTMGLADVVNHYINDRAPWKMIKDHGVNDEVYWVCNTAIQAFHRLVVFLSPILPEFTVKVRAFLGINGAVCWPEAGVLLDRQKICTFEPLAYRITDEQVAPFSRV